MKIRDNKGRFIKGHPRLGGVLFKKGSIPWNKNGNQPQTAKEKAYNWKGDSVKYRGLHMWISNNLGKAKKCSNNIKHISTRYHWVNINHTYKRNFNDWIELCPSCHRLYDNGKIIL